MVLRMRLDIRKRHKEELDLDNMIKNLENVNYSSINEEIHFLQDENYMLTSENEHLRAELVKISELSLSKDVDYKDGYEKCQKIARRALIPIYMQLIPNLDDEDDKI